MSDPLFSNLAPQFNMASIMRNSSIEICFWNLFPGERLIVHENNGKQVEVEVGMSEKRLIFIGNREILSNSVGSCWVLGWVLAGYCF